MRIKNGRVLRWSSTFFFLFVFPPPTRKYAFLIIGHIFHVTSVTNVTILIINVLDCQNLVTACYVFVTSLQLVRKTALPLQERRFVTKC